MDHFRVRLAKETFKFSSTHFTLLSSNEAERLHGHNYHVAVECDVSALGELGMTFEFNSLKPLIKTAVETWDERVLIPRRSTLLKISGEIVRQNEHWIVDFRERSYRFPKTDVVLLETENITSEELARLLALRLAKDWRAVPSDRGLDARIRSLTVTIEETRGQSASFILESPLRRSDLV